MDIKTREPFNISDSKEFIPSVKKNCFNFYLSFPIFFQITSFISISGAYSMKLFFLCYLQPFSRDLWNLPKLCQIGKIWLLKIFYLRFR